MSCPAIKRSSDVPKPEGNSRRAPESVSSMAAEADRKNHRNQITVLESRKADLETGAHKVLRRVQS